MFMSRVTFSNLQHAFGGVQSGGDSLAGKKGKGKGKDGKNSTLSPYGRPYISPSPGPYHAAVKNTMEPTQSPLGQYFGD